MNTETVHLAVYDTMADWEFGYATAHINSPDFQKVPNRYKVTTVGLTLDSVTTKGGITIQPDVPLAELSAQSSSMLILPGADTAASGGIDPFILTAADFIKSNTPVAAICGATTALAKFGLLNTVAHTSNVKEFLEVPEYKGGLHYVDSPAVTGGNIITASGLAPVHFAMEIFRKLDMYSETTLSAWGKLFEARAPEGFYDLMREHS